MRSASAASSAPAFSCSPAMRRPNMPARRSPFPSCLSGFACALAGLCYAELASAVPVAGSAYTYAYASMGEFIAWMIGWDLILEYALGSTTVAIGWSGYVTSFLNDIGLHIPSAMQARPSPSIPQADIGRIPARSSTFPAPFIIVLMSTLAGHRHPQFGDREQCDCRDQARDHHSVHHRSARFSSRHRIGSRSTNPHGAFIPPSAGARALRLGRRAARRRRRLLFLYRLRCDLDRSAGGNRSASAICRARFSARCSFACFFMCSSGWSSPASSPTTN